MFIVDLACEGGHHFEGWYDDAAEYRALAERGEVTCPLCQSAKVERVPSATRISTATSRGEKRQRSTPAPLQPPPAPTSEPAAAAAPGLPATKPSTPMPLPLQQALSRVWREVRRTHEDVGDAFAERALRMHRGEEDPRPILGQATPSEEARLEEEGVRYAKLPVPEIDQN